jgi:glycine cleavage system aminomethyltransferase T
MSDQSLEQLLSTAGSPVELLRNAQAGPNVYPGVPAEYSNWRDEQRAWQETCVLYNQSFHMAELMVEGPDALKLLSSLGVNSFANFAPGKAKQFVPVTPDGYVIGDVILFGLAEDRYNLVGRAPVLNWVTYHAQTGDYKVDVTFDQRTALRNDGKRRHYRFQVQGPNAMQVLEKALGHHPEDLKFFNMRTESLAGTDVCALRHGMAGQPGWELFGPWEDYEAVHAALVEAGEEFGMKLVGGRAYGSNAIESGWIPSPLPAVYTGEALKAYREWLPAEGYEGKASVGGSFVSDNIEDYYFTPWDLSYGHLVKFDHDFIGRDALEAKVDDAHRTKVTLVLDDDDVTRVFASQLQKSDRAKHMEWPNAVYSMHPFDEVKVDDETIGVSTWICYTANEGKVLTLAVIDSEHAEPGTEVTFVWGEENGGTRKPTVEPHVQMELRATVAPVPYVEEVRTSYAPGGWRAAHA